MTRDEALMRLTVAYGHQPAVADFNIAAVNHVLDSLIQAEREKLKTLTNEQIEKVIKDNMLFSMNLAGMRFDLIELVEAKGQA